MEPTNLLEWSAMVVTATGAWLLTSPARGRRCVGFGVFLVSNALWVLWGFLVAAYAVIALQVCLACLNLRGLQKNQ